MIGRSITDTIVFDLDGTLVDTTSDVTRALNRMLTNAGYPTVSRDIVAGNSGKGTTEFIQSIIASTGEPLPDVETLKKLTDLYVEAYSADPVRDSTLHAGVQDALENLSQADVRLGVCTNKVERLANQVLRRLGVSGHFSSVVGGDRLRYRKPHPAHLLASLDELGSGAASSGLVGDSIYDSQCALGAGALSFVVPWAPPEVEGHRLKHFGELLEHTRRAGPNTWKEQA